MLAFGDGENGIKIMQLNGRDIMCDTATGPKSYSSCASRNDIQ
jgi:hypothetical protein